MNGNSLNIEKISAVLLLLSVSIDVLTLNGWDGSKFYEPGIQKKELVALKGSVYDSEGKPLDGARLRMVYGGTQKEILVHMIENGRFEISFERAGSYHLFINKEGYRSAATPLLDEYLEGLELKVVLGERGSEIRSNQATFNNALEMYNRVSGREQQMLGRLMAFYNTPKDERDAFKPIDFSRKILEMEREIQNLLRQDSESEELKIMLIEYLSFKGIQTKVKINRKVFEGDISPAIARRALNIISPGSNLWYLYPESFYAVSLALAEEIHLLKTYADRMITESLSNYTISQCLLFLLRTADRYQNEPVFDEYLAKLLSYYPTTAAAFKAQSEFELPTSLSVGETVPPFAVRDMDRSQILITEQLMLGKYYLMDFWSTSCGGCIQAMPDHTEMYEKFRDRNFTILSTSLDQDIERVERFRESRYPMPWLNAFAEDGFSSKIARDFEIGWLPRLYLVNPEGIIVAKDDELRGKALKQTLARFLK